MGISKKKLGLIIGLSAGAVGTVILCIAGIVGYIFYRGAKDYKAFRDQIATERDQYATEAEYYMQMAAEEATEEVEAEESEEAAIADKSNDLLADAPAEEAPKPVYDNSEQRPAVKQEPAAVAEEPKKKEDIFKAVEQMPQFPGGQAALMQWLSQNIRYPQMALQNGTEGRVAVRFVVYKDGSIGSPTIVKGVDKDLDREAIRVVKSMPKWQPGKNNGQAVNCYYTLPVSFKLQQ